MSKKKRETKQQNNKTTEKQNEELRDLLQRTQAELINYRQRVEKEKLDWIDFGKLAIIKDLLEVDRKSVV